MKTPPRASELRSGRSGDGPRRRSRGAACLVALLPFAGGCGTKIAEATHLMASADAALPLADVATPDVTLSDGALPEASASDAALSDGAVPPCVTLQERLTIRRVDVGDDVRYRRPLHTLASDERIALSAQPNGGARVAWLDTKLAAVHVTSLNADLTRARPEDMLIEGYDVGGIVAHDDGFAILTRRRDPGEPIGFGPGGGTEPADAAFLVRVKEGREVLAAPLTGTKSILPLNPIDNPEDERRDCSPGLRGRLVYNGAKYGSYFVIRGCRNHRNEGHSGDKLVYADEAGRYIRGGWNWRCSNNLGLRLLPEQGLFSSFCISDGFPSQGLNVNVGEFRRLLSREFVPDNFNYSGGDFGSVVKLADDTYLVGWLSRGTKDGVDGGVDPESDTRDIAFLHLARDYTPIGKITWLGPRTRDIEETNLHLAPFGKGRVLAVWDDVVNAVCKNNVCSGKFGGTHAVLVDSDGNRRSPEEIIDASPNQGEDLTVFPNGDVGWAFVPDDRRYDTSADAGVPPAVRQISVARLSYCAN